MLKQKVTLLPRVTNSKHVAFKAFLKAAFSVMSKYRSQRINMLQPQFYESVEHFNRPSANHLVGNILATQRRRVQHETRLLTPERRAPPAGKCAPMTREGKGYVRKLPSSFPSRKAASPSHLLPCREVALRVRRKALLSPFPRTPV